MLGRRCFFHLTSVNHIRVGIAHQMQNSQSPMVGSAHPTHAPAIPRDGLSIWPIVGWASPTKCKIPNPQWWAVPTLRTLPPRDGLRIWPIVGWASPTKCKMPNPQWWAVPTLRTLPATPRWLAHKAHGRVGIAHQMQNSQSPMVGSAHPTHAPCDPAMACAYGPS
jgi:hypothetical protein